MNSDLSRTAARQFLATLQAQLGSPRVGGETAEERKRALSEKYAGMIEKLARFEPSVLKRSADFIIENRKSFPALADCIQVCNEIQASERQSLGSEKLKQPKKRDWSDPAIAKEADAILLCNVELAKLAASDGWLLELWYFCAETGRYPLGCNAEGEDECFTLYMRSLESKAAVAEIKRHPDGSVCEKCARERGAKPTKQIGEIWAAKCMLCHTETTCSSTIDWTWPGIGIIASSSRKVLRFQAMVEARAAEQEQRLIALIEGKRAA